MASVSDSDTNFEPPYRSFISVELPFSLSSSRSVELPTAEQQRELEAFIPPSFLAPCLSCMTSGLQTSKSEGRKRDRSKDEVTDSNRNASQQLRRAELLHDEKAERPDDDDDEFAQDIDLKLGDPNEYKSDPIFTGWRSTNWAKDTVNASGPSEAGDKSGGYNTSTSYTRLRRLDVFPSLEPQLLLQGYYRNDLLVRLTRQKRVRRFRNTTTGAIEHEEELSWSDDDNTVEGGMVAAPNRGKQGQAAGECRALGRAHADVVGVVSREVVLPRPADFTFSLFAPEQQKKAPTLCSGDIFPPSRYLCAKGRVEVPYLMGKHINRTVVPTSCEIEQYRTGVLEKESSLEDLSRSFTTVLNLLVPPDYPRLPPVQSSAQKQYLAEIACSPTGLCPEDPAEVQVIATLLEQRPAWMIKDLMSAVLETGRCPRVYFNRQVIFALTYTITTGPFHRLRIRLGYDPYASARSVIYQRFAIRFLRRSEIGMQLRDLSRSPHIAQVIKQLIETHYDSITAYKKREQGVIKTTLVEQLCRIVTSGALWAPFQLIDIMDDVAIREVVVHCENRENRENMPLDRRASRQGWLTEPSYVHITNLFTDKLQSFIKSEVIPLLHKLSGGHAQLPEDDDDNESGDDESESSNSAQKSLISSGSVNSSFSRSSLSDFDDEDQEK